MTTQDQAEPELKIDVVINKTPVSLFMSFGLLDALLAKFSGEVQVEAAFEDNTARWELIEFVLQKHGDYGMEKVPSKDNIDISRKDLSKIFEWVVDNVTDFFLTQGAAVQRVQEKYKERMLSLAPSKTGSSA
jgi:hypothetical protein